MSSLEFNRFLKENLLDVKTITLPFTETNQNEDILLAKKKAYAQSPIAKSKKIESVVRNLKNMPFETTFKLTNDFDAADEFQILEDLESNLDNDGYNVKVQKKRMEDENSNDNVPNVYDYAIDRKVLDDFKHKLKWFEYKKEKVSNQTDPGDLDVTVIDLNYDKRSSDAEANKVKSEPSAEKTQRGPLTETFTKSPRTETIKKTDNISNSIQEPEEISYSIHNKLLYGPGKKVFSQIEEQDFTGRSSSDRFSKMFKITAMPEKVEDKLQLMRENTFGQMAPKQQDDKEFGQDMTIYKPDSKQTDLPSLLKVLGKMPDVKDSGNNIMYNSRSYKYTVMYKPTDDKTTTLNNSK